MKRARQWGSVLLLAAVACSSAPLASDIPLESYLWRGWSTGSGLPQVSAIDIAQDADGFIWVATIGGLARFDGERFRVYDRTNTPELVSMMLQALHVDSADRLWVASAANLLRRDGRGFTGITLDGAPAEGVRAIAELDNGTLYAGGERLYRVDGDALTVVDTHAGPVHALHARGDTLWIGGTDGIGELGPAGYRWHPLAPRAASERIAHLQWHHDALWAGTDRGLFRFRNGRLTRADLDGTRAEPVHVIHADRRGNLWVCTQSRLLRIRDGAVRETLDHGDWPFGTVISAMDDRDGNLWLGTQTEGLVRLRIPATRHYSTGAGIPDPLAWAVIAWDDDVLVGTDAGAALLANGRYTRYIDPDGLPNPVAYALHQDAAGRLWVGTRAGLSVFTGSERLRTFDEVSHVQVNSVLDDRDGNIWVGTMGGLYRLDSLDGTLADAGGTLAGARVRALHESAGTLWAGTENGLFRRRGEAFERVDEPILRGTFITFIGDLDDGTLVIGTFDRGFALREDAGWRWTRPEDGLPVLSALFVGQVDEHLVVTSLQGVLSIPLAVARGNAPLEVAMVVDDRGSEPPGDAYRCCNGGGNARGLVHRGHVYVPTLDGVIAIPTREIPGRSTIPTPVIEAGTGARGPRDRRFEFSAPLYTRTAALEFRYRLSGYDTGWIDAAHRREATYTNLPAGHYRFEVVAAVDGNGGWSEPAVNEFAIAPYWHETTAARLGSIALAAAMLAALYSAGVAAMRRRQRLLERLVSQRTRELDEANRKLEQASLSDPLTGLHNRRYFDRMLPQIRARGDRSGHPPVCLLLDIDHFKQVNDRHGHAVGDAVLQELATLLRQNLRATDHLIRWGGEEFLIVQENSAAPDDVAARLVDAVARHDWMPTGIGAALTCSVGGAIHPRNHRDTAWSWETTLLLADMALYLVKRRGRNGWVTLSRAPDAPDDLAARLADMDIDTLFDSGWVHATSGRPDLTRPQ